MLRTTHALALAAAAALLLGGRPGRSIAQKAGAVPTPESFFGVPIGKDSNLVDYEQSIAYFRKLTAASGNRMHLINVGTTSFGRP